MHPDPSNRRSGQADQRHKVVYFSLLTPIGGLFIGKPKLSNDAIIGEVLDDRYGILRRIESILRAGNLPQPTLEALIDCKLGLIDVTRKLQTALE